MTSIDRAFIKAFEQEEPAEGSAGACSCQGEGTCPHAAEGTCPHATEGNQPHDPPRPEELAAASQPAVEPASEAASEALVTVSATGDPSAAVSEEAEAAPSGDGVILPDPKPFRPAFQVDSFAWPSGCTRLGMVAQDQLEQLADALLAGQEAGQQVVAMSGCRRGDGCTTLLLCVARRLAERGLKVAVVDADFDNPLLARRLGLLPDAGWEEVLTARARSQGGHRRRRLRQSLARATSGAVARCRLGRGLHRPSGR